MWLLPTRRSPHFNFNPPEKIVDDDHMTKVTPPRYQANRKEISENNKRERINWKDWKGLNILLE